MRMLVHRQNLPLIVNAPIILTSLLLQGWYLTIFVNATRSWHIGNGRLGLGRGNWHFLLSYLNQNIVFEFPLLYALPRQKEHPLAMLYPPHPFPLVITSITPIHLAITRS